MVDLFGKRRYQERIEELEAGISALEKEHQDLQRTLTKRDDRIKKLSRDYQEAQVALKEANRKLASVDSPSSDSLSKAAFEEGPGSGKEHMTPQRLLQLLARLEGHASPKDDLIAAYLPAEGPTDGIFQGVFQGHLEEVQALIEAVRPGPGAAVLHEPEVFTMVLVPPFPLEERISRGKKFDLAPLREMLDTPVLLVSAHAGDTLLGVALSWEGLEASVLIKGEIKEKHSKGGWSQKRFERLREEEIRNYGEEVATRLRAMLEEYRPLIRYVVMSGDPALLKAIRPTVDMPVIERRLERHDRKRPARLLEDLYGFVLYRG